MSRDDSLVIQTRVAHAGHVEHRFFGHGVYKDLAGRVSLAGLVAIGINGRRLTESEVGILDDIAAVWTIADPRIWPLKVVRLASAFGGPLQGFAASLLCQDCSYVGIWQSSPATARWLIELGDLLKEGPRDSTRVAHVLQAFLESRRFIPGFGVPYRDEDERVAPMWQRLIARERDRLEFVQIFAKMGEVVRNERGMNPNIAGLTAAICLDLGFSADEIGMLLIALGTHMFVANAREGAEQTPEVLQRIPDDRVRYVGRAPRLSPKAAAHETGLKRRVLPEIERD